MSDEFRILLDQYANLFMEELIAAQGIDDENVDYAKLGKQAYKAAGAIMKCRAQILSGFEPSV